MRLMIATLSHRDPKQHFQISLDSVVGYLSDPKNSSSLGLEGLCVQRMAGCSNLGEGRHEIIRRAYNWKATDILLLDDDMVFPADIAALLYTRKKDIIGVNYVEKQPIRKFTARHLKTFEPVSSIGRSGIERVASTGFGVVLLKMSVLDKIKPPYFQMAWDELRKETITEDNYFFAKLREHGLDVWLDHDASQNIGHVGDYVYTMHSHG